MKFDPSYAPIIGALIAGLFVVGNVYLTNYLQDRARRLDLYKIAYPKKVEAAFALLDKSSRAVWEYAELERMYKGDNKEDLIQALEKITSYSSEIGSSGLYYIAILGENIAVPFQEFYSECSAFHDLCSKTKPYIPEAYPVQRAKMIKAYNILTIAIRQSIHLQQLEVAVHKNAKSSFQALENEVEIHNAARLL